jgi:signal transduction histidine kinase
LTFRVLAEDDHLVRLSCRQLRALMGMTFAVLVASLGGALALQLASGGIRVLALGPAVLGASIGAFGCLITLRRPGLRLGPVLLVNGIGFALGYLAASALDYGAVHPIPPLAGQGCFAIVAFSRILVAAWVLFILWFPDGRFTSRAWRRFFVAAIALCTLVSLAVWIGGPADRVFDFYRGTSVPPGAGSPLSGTWDWLARASNLLLLLPLIALGSLVQRYRAGGAVLRQQVRWLLVAMGVEVLAQIIGASLLSAGGSVRAAGSIVGIATQPLPMLAATIAILRYRLWEMDLVVSRAVVYGVLWAGLSALLLVPALAAGLLVGGSNALAAVGIALVVTVVFQPTRRRLDALAQRLVHRHRARPYVLMSGFWEALRTTDLVRLGPLLVDAMRTGLGIEWAGMWVFEGSRQGGALRRMDGPSVGAEPAAAVSAAVIEQLSESPALVLSGHPATELEPLWEKPPEVVVPLVADDTLVGMLACGGRRGDRLGPADFEVLELLARECALRLRNLRLESQLRERLTQIESQATELLRSRQRLVTAQDEERRRIERNLHDGVQQQLVSLAVRLQRAAADGGPLLAGLAAEAEQAVFALQELGRGIYPSVLSDQGLPAALRAQAARVPLPVHIEVDDILTACRLDRETEAALYFVALEALTNAYKHAPGASVAIWLHAHGHVCRLDVVDNGPGFERPRGSGSGLQNMHDRVEAAGGTLAVQSHPGHGTEVTASIPAPLVPTASHAQPAEADSRR